MSQQEDKNNQGLAPTRLPRALPYRSFVLTIGTEVEDRFEGTGVTPERITRYVAEEFASQLKDAVRCDERAREEICATWPDYVLWEDRRAILALIPQRSGTLKVVRLVEQD